MLLGGFGEQLGFLSTALASICNVSEGADLGERLLACVLLSGQDKGLSHENVVGKAVLAPS